VDYHADYQQKRFRKSVDELLPWLCLKGISTGDFREALAALFGPKAAGLSSTMISGFKTDWWKDYKRGRKSGAAPPICLPWLLCGSTRT